jgi:hypothetical protein
MRCAAAVAGCVLCLSFGSAGCLAKGSGPGAFSGPCVQSPAVHEPATAASKELLLSDLRSGKLTAGALAESIRASYGDADEMIASRAALRLRYRISPRKTLTLWFDDGCHLSMWSD